MKNNKLIDMHTHTNYSDGQLSPQELIQLAVDKNIGVLAITDHDTLEGSKTVDRSDKFIVDNGIRIINGIELSAKVTKGRMHILGYNIDINNELLNKKMLELKDNSINSVLSIIEQIKRDYNIRFGYDDLKELVNANHNLGRPDVAKLCVKYGYANSVSDAFEKYLNDAYDKTRQIGKGLPYKECLELIVNSGGIPVLAHPKTLDLDDSSTETIVKLIDEIFKFNNNDVAMEVLIVDYDDNITINIKDEGKKNIWENISKDLLDNKSIKFTEVLGFNNTEYVIDKS